MTTKQFERGDVVDASEADDITQCESSEYPHKCPLCGAGITPDGVYITESLLAYTHCANCDSDYEWQLKLTGRIVILSDNFHLQDENERQEIRDSA